MSKIFGIGFHKTGTTSLGEALEYLGYMNTHGAKALRHSLGQEHMMKCLVSGDLSPVWEVADQYDSFQDNPWQMLYRQADQRFPGSKFVLTVRNPESWFKSVHNQFAGRQSEFRAWVYGSDYNDPKGNKKHYIDRYKKHNREVQAYFHQRPEDLLVLDIGNGDGWKELCSFLKLPIPQDAFPHANKRDYPTLMDKVVHKIRTSLSSHD